MEFASCKLLQLCFTFDFVRNSVNLSKIENPQTKQSADLCICVEEIPVEGVLKTLFGSLEKIAL